MSGSPINFSKLPKKIEDRFDKSVSEGMEMREFMESLREKDRTKSIPEQFVLAVRSNMMLRGISRLFQINNLSLAKEWERYADFALKEYPSNAVDDEIVEFN